MTKALTIWLSLALLALPAAAQTRRVPSRAELGGAIVELRQQLAELRAELAKADPARAAAGEERLAALEKAIAELRARLDEPDAAGRLEELSAAVEELREDAATKGDLKKYVRKPDEKEFKSRIAQELELRAAFVDLREDELAARVGGLAQLAMVPGITPRARGLLAAIGALGAQLEDNDARLRPRLLLRLTWEANRFLDED